MLPSAVNPRATKFRWLVLLGCGLLATIGRAESPVQIAPPASWVEVLPEPALTPTPPEEVSHGYDYLRLHQQVNVAEQASFQHNVYRITTEGSLQSGARLTWNFDPTYEELTLHHVRVIRGDTTQDRLNAEAVRVIQRERDLDRHLLNGDLTAFVLLEDIRVGDVVDYAFSRRGWNPTFGGRYFDSVSTGWSVPVRHQRLRIDAPAGRPIQHRKHGAVQGDLAISRDGESDTYVWEARDLTVIPYESEAPDWYVRYPFFQFSEFTDWAQVVEWAQPLYAVPEPVAPALLKQAQELTAGRATPEAKVVAVLQFVQQEVRYLGMELGAGSYRPTQPAEVFARRFGDCKDKTLLLCTLLRLAGVTAHPALLNTDQRGHIDQWLPSPQAFDHVIACVPTADGLRWVDPTLTYQQGSLETRGLPNYERALVVRPGESGLADVTIPAGARRSVRIEERFDIASFDGPAQLEIVTRSTGLNADSARRYLAENTPDEISKQYVNYYASAYPGIKALRPVSWTDDRERNVVVATEHYEVPHFWQTQDDGALKAEFYPKNLTEYATRPDRTVRTSPLAVAHPAAMELQTTVHLPEDWNVKPEDTVTDAGAFEGRIAIEGEGRVVTMRYAWTSRSDHVPTDQVPAYVKTLTTFRESLGYTLTHRAPAADTAASGPAPAAPFRLNWLLVLVVVVTLTLATVAAVKLLQLPPRPAAGEPPLLDSAQARLAGLGGWLVLVGIGVVVRPFVLLSQMMGEPRHAFNQDVWERLTTPGDTAYQPVLGPLIIGETAANTLMLAACVLLVVLFFRKKRAFPAVFVFLLAFTLIVQVADNWIGQAWVNGFEFDIKGLSRAAGQAFVWIPYALVSRRVKATFVR